LKWDGTGDPVPSSDYIAGSLLLLAVPIGANHGPVALMTNVALPIALIVLLRKPRAAFS
jgi:hypothetical protein